MQIFSEQLDFYPTLKFYEIYYIKISLIVFCINEIFTLVLPFVTGDCSFVNVFRTTKLKQNNSATCLFHFSIYINLHLK